MGGVVEEVDADAEFFGEAAERRSVHNSCRKGPFMRLAGEDLFRHFEADFDVRSYFQR